MLRHFLDLAGRLIGTEIDRGAYGDSAHVPGFLHGAEHDLVELVRVRKEFVVVDLDDEWDLVRVLARNGGKHTIGGSNGIAAAFNGKLHDVLRIEVDRVRREGCTGRMFDTLVHRQNGNVTGVFQTTVSIQDLQTADDLVAAVGRGEDAIQEIGSRKMKVFFGNGLGLVVQQAQRRLPATQRFSQMT